MSCPESLFFLIAGLAVAIAALLIDSDFGVAIGAVVAAMGLEELLKPRIDRLTAGERAEGGEG